jgi:hypothetical protein
MAATGEWVDIPFTLMSPFATLSLNDASGDRYLMVPQGCNMGASLRTSKTNIPQQDGSILHRRWFSGYECTLTLDLWYNDEPACGDDLVRMLDALNGVCWSLRDAGDNEGRLLWTPTVRAVRMLDDIRLLEELVVNPRQDGPGVLCTFAIDTVYPYAQNFTQITTALPDTLSNGGTAEYWPVFQIDGPASAFTLTNTTTGLSIVYDSSLPGGITVPGGSYVEIDCFRSTAFINGDGANAIGSIDIPSSDFFSLVPGDNVLTLSGGLTGDALWADAWS